MEPQFRILNFQSQTITRKLLNQLWSPQKSLSYDAILGKDFLKRFDIDVRNRRGLWRSREGKWSKFWTKDPESGTQIYGECAGLAEMTLEQAAEIE